MVYQKESKTWTNKIYAELNILKIHHKSKGYTSCTARD